MTNFFFDPRVTDPDIMEDMTLAAEVVRQASDSEGALSQAQVDELLGLQPRRPSEP